jgi:predicted hydrocarbon binding protein
MENAFKRSLSETHNVFKWENLGDITEGRGDLGEDMPVVVYRLMQFTMLDVLTKALGSDKANDIFRDAGFLAGTEFAKHVLDLTVDLDSFVANLQAALEEFKIGILRMEVFDAETGNLTLTVSQDLDCSGLPITNETVCTYDEGFIAGILNSYTGKEYDVREIDCWASGDRTCRFSGVVV